MCRSALQQLVQGFEYFLGILPDGSGLAAPLNPGFKAPIQLGRQVLAQLAGAPERWAAWGVSGSALRLNVCLFWGGVPPGGGAYSWASGAGVAGWST